MNAIVPKIDSIRMDTIAPRYVWLDEDEEQVSPVHGSLGRALSFVQGWQYRWDKLVEKYGERGGGMKVLLNVDRDMLDPLGPDWVECQGFRLMEMPDGSFELIVTTDIAAARRGVSDAIGDAIGVVVIEDDEAAAVFDAIREAR